MRICILTQPLQNNYGGLLQAYALQTILRRMGHDVWTEDRVYNKLSFLDKIRRMNLVRKIFGKKCFFIPNSIEEATISQHTHQFVKEYIVTTVPINDVSKKKLDQYQFEAYIVGSDQVWRPCYSLGLYNYFLDFALGKDVKKIAYAASFGVDNWEYTKKQEKRCAFLIKFFNAVSVREDSAIILCNKYLGVNAIQVLDPTMLIDKEDYMKLVLQAHVLQSKGNLMTYLLDYSSEKQEIIEKVVSTLNLRPFAVMPLFKFQEVGNKKIEDCIFPPVTEWIRGFQDAEFVVADSFHGCVFSIIFEKPFIAIINKERGATRFTSLLTMFGLMDRMVNSLAEVTDEVLKTSIDWSKVRKIKEKKAKEAKDFLKDNLVVSVPKRYI